MRGPGLQGDAETLECDFGFFLDLFGLVVHTALVVFVVVRNENRQLMVDPQRAIQLAAWRPETRSRQ
jgi:hypothetical protein